MPFNGYKHFCLTLALTAGVICQTGASMASGLVASQMPAGAVGHHVHQVHSKHAGKTQARSGGANQSGKAAVHGSKSAAAVKAGKGEAAKKARAGKVGKAAKTARAGKAGKKSRKLAKRPPAIPMRPPQEETGSLSQVTLAPGVVHKFHRGPLSINIIDVDLTNPNVEVKPVLAGNTFNTLDEVRDQASKVNAIAAVNANYFKKDGTPLGTLVMDGEWVAGPLYDRMSFGLTDSGQVHVDRANLHGTIETSNPNVSSLWVNNINQPRRSGCKLVAYTRRWGSEVKMAYEGVLVSVDSSGRVLDKATQTIAIPSGGFVLSDTKHAVISKLRKGDLVFLEWHHRPNAWADVVQAVSGGPALIKNGNLFLDLKDENFRKTWTSSSIHARTALGVTDNHHLILATVEGPHTLWDLAKMLHKLGCVEAMNLDGGGSTTMVVKGNIVTRNKNSFQRRVAASLAVLPRSHAPSIARRRFGQYVPQTDLSAIFHDEADKNACLLQVPVADPVANEIETHVLNNEPALPELPQLAKDSSVEVKQEAPVLVEPIVVDDDEPQSKPTKKHKKHKKNNSLSQSLSKTLNTGINKSLDLEFGWMKGWLGSNNSK